MYCGNCGKEINDKNKFCPNCGNRIQQDVREETKEQFVTVTPIAKNNPMPQHEPTVPQNATQISENIPEASEQPYDTQPTPVHQQIQAPVYESVPAKKKSSKKLFWIIGAVLLAAISIAAGVFLFTNSDKDQKPAKTVKQFKAIYSDNEGTDFSDYYEIVEQDKCRIYKWTVYDSETDLKAHEIIFEYDDKNKVETRYYYDSDNELYQKSIYTLDNDGKYEMCKVYNLIDGEENFAYEFYFVGLDMVGKIDVPDDYSFVEYDEYNRITVWEDHYSDGSWYRTTNEYNEHGLISEKSVDYEGYESEYKLTPIS